MAKLPKTYLQFKKRHAKVWRAYDRLGAAAAESGPLDVTALSWAREAITSEASDER